MMIIRKAVCSNSNNTSKTPRLNGLAKRIYRKLVKRVNCLLSHTRLQTEALSIVIHILNFTPHVSLEFHVPNMVWIGNDVSYDICAPLGARRLCKFLNERSA